MSFIFNCLHATYIITFIYGIEYPHGDITSVRVVVYMLVRIQVPVTRAYRRVFQGPY